MRLRSGAIIILRIRKRKPMKYEIKHGDCLEVLRGMADSSIDAIVTDPPYGLSFMGKKWDYDVPSVDIWRECLRVLKPGGHLLSFAGTRTQHRMAVNIEDAGFEIRDMIAWVYGSGFPKSRDISKDMDRSAGAKREVIGTVAAPGMALTNVDQGAQKRSVYTFDKLGGPVTDVAKQWQGWGTALKPAVEPITVARKPFKGTVAANVLAHGTGAINVDGGRVGTEPPAPRNAPKKVIRGGNFHAAAEGGREMSHFNPTQGRFPANLIHDGSDEVVGLFPVTGASKSAPRGNLGKSPFSGIDGSGRDNTNEVRGHNDNGGSAARFFYCAKASKADRDEGCEGLEETATAYGNQAQAEMKRGNLTHADGKSGMNAVQMRRNHHPTVKPTALMRYLCRLVTPPKGIILDPFTGSGSTGSAAMLEGFNFIGIEREAEYVEIAKARIEKAQDEMAGMLL
jgi:DNA modification methylase